MSKGRRYRILMFAPFFPPRLAAQANVAAKLVLAFLRRGWEVDVITFPKFTVSYKDPCLLKELGTGIYPVPDFQPKAFTLMIDRAIGTLLTGHPITGVVWARHAISKAKRLLDSKTYDFLMSRSGPLEGHLPAMALASKTKIPWIAYWDDPEPPKRNPPPYGSGPAASNKRGQERYMKSVASSASWHGFPSVRLMEYMASMYSDMRGKSSAIPHLAFTDRGASIHYDQDPNKFRLCHAGLFDQQRRPETFLEGLSRFLSGITHPSSVSLVLLGNEFHQPVDLRIPFTLQHFVEVKEWCNYLESLSLMAKSTVLVLVEAPLDNGVYFPSKIADYAESGRPILAVSPNVGTVSDLIHQYGGGIAADCTSPDEIASAIEKLYLSWKAGRLEKDYDVERLTKALSEKKVIGQYEELFDRLGMEGT